MTESSAIVFVLSFALLLSILFSDDLKRMRTQWAKGGGSAKGGRAERGRSTVRGRL
ncbi:hypothetical protein [Streptomyces sp. HNM0574]|uniref:hypothetical protein n=1 Tax=Streptomyces sp. HNM0574 TaxID=2714954 RepID=UPI00146C27F2|nr:hypothetical protein [Streptomyces sp. HNM0574]NLU68510.1 hypothetical protein [Streptomyces sp. HNM0574]